MVPTGRLELPRLSSLPPQDSVSTNFTTSALYCPPHPEWRGTARSRDYFGMSFNFPSDSDAPGACAGFVVTAVSAAGGALIITPLPPD